MNKLLYSRWDKDTRYYQDYLKKIIWLGCG